MLPQYYVKPGDVLRHYKGEEYAVLAVCHNEKDPNQMDVAYINLKTGQPWTRELSKFNETLIPEDTETYGTEEVVRFEVIGEVQILVNAGGNYGDFAVVALQLPETE